MVEVSYSSVKTWQRCHRAYHYKYREEIVRKTVSRPLKFGKLIHKLIEDTIEQRSLSEIPDDPELEGIEDIIKSYQQYWKNDSLKFVKYQGKRSEHWFKEEIAPGIILKGVIDAIGENDQGTWLVEHKSTSSEWTDSMRWRNVQSTLYLAVWPRSLCGTCWNYIYSKAPSEPVLTKNGQISKARIVTLPVVVSRFAKENRLKPNDVAGVMAVADECLQRYFSRVYQPRNSSVEKLILKEFISVAKSMARSKAKDRNIDRHCDWCEYEPLCRAKLLNQDYKFVLKHQYEER